MKCQWPLLLLLFLVYCSYAAGNTAENEAPESKVLELDQAGAKEEKEGSGTKVKGPSKKTASKLLPLLLIPLMIQGQMIPMMLFQLKMMALKALFVGKLALIIVVFNIIRNAMIGANDIDEQYEQQTLESQHYGYNGGPEYGSWVNRRLFTEINPFRGYYQ